MPKLFGVDIAGILHQNLSPGLLPGRLYAQNTAVRDPDNPTAGPIESTPTLHTFKGIVNNYTDNEVDNNLILREDRKILIIANSLSPAITPETGMSVQVDGSPGTFIIIRVKRDPASATYLCQGRR